jgi:hypothetical protein
MSVSDVLSQLAILSMAFYSLILQSKTSKISVQHVYWLVSLKSLVYLYRNLSKVTFL